MLSQGFGRSALLGEIQNETGLVLGRMVIEANSPASPANAFRTNGVLFRGPSGRLASDASQTDTGDTSRNNHNPPSGSKRIVQWYN